MDRETAVNQHMTHTEFLTFAQSDEERVTIVICKVPLHAPRQEQESRWFRQQERCAARSSTGWIFRFSSSFPNRHHQTQAVMAVLLLSFAGRLARQHVCVCAHGNLLVWLLPNNNQRGCIVNVLVRISSGGSSFLGCSKTCVSLLAP